MCKNMKVTVELSATDRKLLRDINKGIRLNVQGKLVEPEPDGDDDLCKRPGCDCMDH